MRHPERSEGAKTALITGASAGIGLELAHVFARHGHNLILVARSADKLRDLADDLKGRYGISARILVKDLSGPGSPAQVLEEIQNQKISVDILVNNAGFGTYGLFAETNLEKELELIRLNISALTHLAKLFLPGMLARKSGKIMNVASTAAFQPGPLMAVYYASKSYVLSFSEALATELSGTGVSVTALCPGPTESEFQKTAGIHENLLLFKLTMMKARKVAEIGYAGLMKGKRIVIPGFLNRLLPFGVRIAPRGLVTTIVRRVQKSSKHSQSAETGTTSSRGRAGITGSRPS